MNPTFSPRSLARASSSVEPRSAPSRTTEPPLGVSSPARRPSSVVLPLPEGPTIATSSPCSIVKVTLRSTARWLSPLRYSFDRFRATSMSAGYGWMRPPVLAVAVMLVAACAGGGSPESSEGGTREAASVDAASPATLRRTIVFVGTSLTAGLGLDAEQAFPALIGAKIDSAGLPYEVINAGSSGETSAGALRRIDWILRQPMDVLVIET